MKKLLTMLGAIALLGLAACGQLAPPTTPGAEAPVTKVTQAYVTTTNVSILLITTGQVKSPAALQRIAVADQLSFNLIAATMGGRVPADMAHAHAQLQALAAPVAPPPPG
jgi:hypothetical protein